MIGVGLGLTGVRRRRVSAPPPAATLVAHGSGISLGAPDGAGYSTFTTDASSAARAVGSGLAIAGDLLLEIVPLAAPPNIMFALDDVAAAAGRSYLDCLEAVQTEAGGGGAAWLGAWKSGLLQGVLAARNGNVYLERVGPAWRIYTGTTWAAASNAGAIHSGTAADTGPRFLVVTDIGPGASVALRYAAHPG